MSNVIIIADCAGRMNELGKKYLQEYLLRTIANLLSNDRYDDIEPIFMSWGSCISQLDESLTIECGGRSDVDQLNEMLASMDMGTSVMILSDGNFDCTGVRKTAEKASVNIVGIIVGADADASAMNFVSTSRKAFKAEEITAAVSLLSSYIE